MDMDMAKANLAKKFKPERLREIERPVPDVVRHEFRVEVGIPWQEVLLMGCTVALGSIAGVGLVWLVLQ
jgi:hypothetical protein